MKTFASVYGHRIQFRQTNTSCGSQYGEIVLWKGGCYGSTNPNADQNAGCVSSGNFSQTDSGHFSRVRLSVMQVCEPPLASLTQQIRRLVRASEPTHIDWSTRHPSNAASHRDLRCYASRWLSAREPGSGRNSVRLFRWPVVTHKGTRRHPMPQAPRRTPPLQAP